MLPGDRLVCAFVKPQKAGARFEEWLLHVTIVPWFRLEGAASLVAAGLEQALRPIVPFDVVARGAVRFGPKKDRPARLMEPTPPFVEIESRVRRYFHKKRAWLVDETTKRPRQFRPHVTFQKDSELSEGQTFHIDKLYIVEQKGDYKEIVAEISLG
jgi:2'-5' RNA ligase